MFKIVCANQIAFFVCSPAVFSRKLGGIKIAIALFSYQRKLTDSGAFFFLISTLLIYLFLSLGKKPFLDMPCINRVYREKKDCSTGRQPRTKKKCLPDKPLVNH